MIFNIITQLVDRYPRRLIQSCFTVLTIWIGLEFYAFVHQLESGSINLMQRPAGVEAFLPISALISLNYWLSTGIFNTIHPSALVLLIIFIVISVLFKKGFCSWICPVGLLSEYLVKIHIKIFDRQRKPPAWLDYPLRSLKYLLLLFFAHAIFFQMNTRSLEHFIYSPYNRIADIKMLYFFTDMTSVTLWTLVLLVLFSIAIPYFWCRYLCPYGALLGMLSWLSPFKIRRNETSCIDCEKCTKVCPAKINVHSAKSVISDECHACLQCVEACPVENTLDLTTGKSKFLLKPKLYALIILFTFALGTTTARLSGVWQNSISEKEYRYHIQHLNDPDYNHFRGNVADYNEDVWGKGKFPNSSSQRSSE